jgi:endonuclease-3
MALGERWLTAGWTRWAILGNDPLDLLDQANHLLTRDPETHHAHVARSLACRVNWQFGRDDDNGVVLGVVTELKLRDLEKGLDWRAEKHTRLWGDLELVDLARVLLFDKVKQLTSGNRQGQGLFVIDDQCHRPAAALSLEQKHSFPVVLHGAHRDMFGWIEVNDFAWHLRYPLGSIGRGCPFGTVPLYTGLKHMSERCEERYLTIESARRRAMQVHRRLLRAYGDPYWRSDLDAVSQLVSTILSQNTNDLNRDRAYERLRARFPTWEAVRDADEDAVKCTIRVAGLANHKAPAIQRALRFITARRGVLSLDFLREMPVSEAKAWLTAINGVGPKTAAVVLLFALGMPAFPVDTHIHRVTRRLGLIGEKVSREEAHGVLEALLPEPSYYAFHLNVIHHGRHVCVSRRPRCDTCVIQDLCAFYRQAATTDPGGADAPTSR